MQRRRTVLAIDDNEINLMLLVRSIKEMGYAVQSFTSSVEGWHYLEANPEQVDIVLCDKLMPNLSGLEILKRIKANEALRRIPVIIQTGDAGVTQMREGLETGAYYYLTRPFHPEILTAILHSASIECDTREGLVAQLSATHSQFLSLMHEGEFIIKTHAEALVMATMIANAATYPEFIAIGLMELFSNAIEHGNLEIGHEYKHKCLMTNSWNEELARRMADPELGARIVRIRFEKTTSGLRLSVKDEGKGFEWRNYVYDDEGPNRLHSPNGRGIAKSMIMLDDVRYSGNGNEVSCHIGLPSVLALVSDSPHTGHYAS